MYSSINYKKSPA